MSKSKKLLRIKKHINNIYKILKFLDDMYAMECSVINFHLLEIGALTEKIEKELKGAKL